MTLGDSPPGAADPVIGKTISDRYRVIRKLGEGGMGSVYLAEHVVIEKKVALKILASDLARRPDLAARFLQEAKSASRIGHENVIDISDFAESPDGLVYIAMEYLDGIDLGEAVRGGGPMSWQRAKGIMLQICRALAAAHAQGIIHRDMKPENIFLIQREGRPDFVKLLDFGVAKVMGTRDNVPRLTQTGMIFGTPEYMAPEQAEGKDPDHRVDVYAVGCVMYHLITGEPPFKAESFMAVLTKHLRDDPVAPSVRRPDLGISPEMDALVLKALDKDRERRWQSMTEFLGAVSSCRAPVASGRPHGQANITRPLGGSDVAIAAQPTLAIRASANDAIPDRFSDDFYEQPSPPRKGMFVLVAVGAILGAVAALVWLVGERAAPRSAEAPSSAQIPPASSAPVPAAVAPAAEVAPRKPRSGSPRRAAEPAVAEDLPPAGSFPSPSVEPPPSSVEPPPPSAASPARRGGGLRRNERATGRRSRIDPQAPETAERPPPEKPDNQKNWPATPPELKPFPQ